MICLKIICALPVHMKMHTRLIYEIGLLFIYNYITFSASVHFYSDNKCVETRIDQTFIVGKWCHSEDVLLAKKSAVRIRIKFVDMFF